MNTPIFAIIWVSHPVWWTYVNRHDLFRHTRCLSRSDSRRYKKVKNLDFLMLWCRFSQSYEVYLEHEICMAWICRLTWCLSACLTFKVQNLDLVMKWHPFQSTGWQLILVNISRICLIEKACTLWEENIFCCAGVSISTSARTQYISSVQDSSPSALLLNWSYGFNGNWNLKTSRLCFQFGWFSTA